MSVRLAAIGLALAVAGATWATVSATSAMAQGGEIQDMDSSFYHGRNMMWGGDYWGGFGMVLGPILIVLVLAAVVLVAVYVMRQFGGSGSAGSGQPAQDRAIAFLKERYAKGEIDTAEYEERRKLLAD